MLNLIEIRSYAAISPKNAIEFVKDYDWETNQCKYLDILENLGTPSPSSPTVVEATHTRGSGAHPMNHSLSTTDVLSVMSHWL